MRPVEHRPYMPPSGGGQPYPASRDMTTPFPFGFLLAMLWDIKPRGNGKPWAMEPAVEDTGSRSASDRTRPRFFFFGLCSTQVEKKPSFTRTAFYGHHLPSLNNKWATFTGYPSIRITCFVLMKLVYSQQKFYKK